MSEPVGSLRDLQELLEGRGGYVFAQRPFPFYSVLMYAPTNGLNKLLHEYVTSHFELFNVQTGPNWLVAVLEDINRKHSIKDFRPQDVYDVARYLGARVDDVPAIVFFTEPKDRNETLVLNLEGVFPDSGKVADEDLTKLFSKIAAIIDDICQRGVPSDDRLTALREALKREWSEDPTWGTKITSAVEWLKVSAASATTVLGAITSIAKLLKASGLF